MTAIILLGKQKRTEHSDDEDALEEASSDVDELEIDEDEDKLKQYVIVMVWFDAM